MKQASQSLQTAREGGKQRDWLARGVRSLFAGCLFFALGSTARAQFTYVTNAGTITITGYNGPGGAVVVPLLINRMFVTSIGDWAFSDSLKVKTIVLGNSVTSIGVGAFAASGLTGVTIPPSVTNMGYGAFSACRGLTNAVIGSGVTCITNSMFQYSGLESITIPDTVTNIGNYAFWYSSNLASVTIGSGVASVGLQAFSYCPRLAEINVDPSNSSYLSVRGVLFSKDRSVLVQFPEACFATAYNVPSTVTTIADWAFAGSANLASVNITGNATYVGDYAFLSCSNLAQANAPNGLGYQAFCACVSLTNMVVGQGNIGDEAFALCSNLTSVTIGSGVTGIGEGAFYSDALPSLAIPGTVTNIGVSAFEACANLKAIYFLGNAPSLGLEAFDGDGGTVYYAPGTTGWGASFGGLPAVELNGVSFTATPTNGTGPLTVNFTSAGTDSGGVPIFGWNWSFGDGSSSTAQNPSHTYASVNTFYPALMASNRLGQTVLGPVSTAITVGPPRPAVTALSDSGGNLAIKIANGMAGGIYCVLATADPTRPLSQWTPVATNVLNTSGEFTMTVGGTMSQGFQRQFYALQCHGPSPSTNAPGGNPTGPQP